jgi:putative transposase
LLAEAQQRCPMRILHYCVMPNHFHFEVWPETPDSLPAYMRWLMNAHVRQYHHHYQTCGTGHIYQGRYKNFPIQTDRHLLTVSKYIEANPVRAGLVRRAEDWKWSSLSTDDSIVRPELTEGPVARPANWAEWVNLGVARDELDAVRKSVRRGRPFGDDAWTTQVAETYGLDFTVRRPGRPRKNRDTQLFAKADDDDTSMLSTL